jgi:hypothetical protein
MFSVAHGCTPPATRNVEAVQPETWVTFEPGYMGDTLLELGHRGQVWFSFLSRLKSASAISGGGAFLWAGRLRAVHRKRAVPDPGAV